MSQEPSSGRNFKYDSTDRTLGTKTVRSGTAMLVSQVFLKLLNLFVIGIMARLVTPREYGLLGMVYAFVVFLEMVADMGLTLATVQKSDIDEKQLSVIFWINMAVGLLMSLVCFSCAPLIAAFYHEPTLSDIARWIAPCFLLNVAGAQHNAILIRGMKFVHTSACEVAGVIAGAAVGIYMATQGFGVYSLVGQLIATSTAKSALAWILSGWVPALPSRNPVIREVLKIGGYLTAFNFINYFSKNMDKVILGRIDGASSVGLYTRAYTLMDYPIRLVSFPIGRVMISALARLKDDAVRFRSAYLKGLTLICMIHFPMITGAFAVSDDIITVVFGAKWIAAAPVLRAMCLAGLWHALYVPTGQIFVSLGRTDLMFRMGVITAVLFVSSFCIGSHWGAEGVALSYGIALTVILLPYLRVTYSLIGLKLTEVIKAVSGPLGAAILMAIPVCLLSNYLQDNTGIGLRLPACIVTGAFTYVLTCLLLCPARVRQMSKYILEHMKKGDTADAE